MNDTNSEIDADLAVLDQLEIAARNMLPHLQAARRVLTRWDEPRFAEAVGPIVTWITRCSPAPLVDALIRLRAAIDSER